MSRDKEDLRRLMKEKMGAQPKEAQSPYAKTLSSGRLVCTICPGVAIKNWNTHQISAQHKRNVIASKTTQTMKPPVAIPKAQKPAVDLTKTPAKSILKNPLNPSGPTEQGNHKRTEPASTEEQSRDNIATKRPASPNDEDEPSPKKSAPDPAASLEDSSALPEGFFDDPKLDAKARNIEYRDPKEVEWELFQKALREEDNKSEQVVEIDEEKEMKERELYETDEMISNWEKVRELEIRKDQIQKSSDEPNDVEMEDDDDQSDFGEFLDWRQKAVK